MRIEQFLHMLCQNWQIEMQAKMLTEQLSLIWIDFFSFFSSCHAYISVCEVGQCSNKDQLLNISLCPRLLCFRVPVSLFCSVHRTACFPKLLCGSLIIVSAYLKLSWIYFALLLYDSTGFYYLFTEGGLRYEMINAKWTSRFSCGIRDT